jgi:hypothetical protein
MSNQEQNQRSQSLRINVIVGHAGKSDLWVDSTNGTRNKPPGGEVLNVEMGNDEGHPLVGPRPTGFDMRDRVRGFPPKNIETTI